jgi:hypothetical protein
MMESTVSHQHHYIPNGDMLCATYTMLLDAGASSVVYTATHTHPHTHTHTRTYKFNVVRLTGCYLV